MDYLRERNLKVLLVAVILVSLALAATMMALPSSKAKQEEEASCQMETQPPEVRREDLVVMSDRSNLTMGFVGYLKHQSGYYLNLKLKSLRTEPTNEEHGIRVRFVFDCAEMEMNWYFYQGYLAFRSFTMTSDIAGGAEFYCHNNNLSIMVRNNQFVETSNYAAHCMNRMLRSVKNVVYIGILQVNFSDGT